MYTAATHLIETLSHSTFSAFLHEQLLRKLDMGSTFLQPSEVHHGKQDGLLSTPYYFRDGAYHETCHQETPEAQGAGSIQTSVNGLAKFIRAMINQAGPITDAIYEAITKPRIIKSQRSKLQKNRSNDPPASYALGWDVHYYRGAQIISHDGVITGYGSRMFFLPDYKVGAVILGNSDGAFDLSFIIQSSLVDEILDIPKEQRFDVANQRLQRFTAQEARREKNLRKNAARRDQTKGTLEMPIEAYLGSYHNRGYRDVTVQEKGGLLFIDGRDRSMPFTMLLEHVSNNTVFRGYLADDTGEDVVSVRFRIGSDGQASTIGMVLEPALGDDGFIWFDRMQQI
ncbi:beta-lactamase/transpeptidase-like protein, partial [Aureobasidium melanogenum]